MHVTRISSTSSLETWLEACYRKFRASHPNLHPVQEEVLFTTHLLELSIKRATDQAQTSMEEYQELEYETQVILDDRGELLAKLDDADSRLRKVMDEEKRTDPSTVEPYTEVRKPKLQRLLDATVGTLPFTTKRISVPGTASTSGSSHSSATTTTVLGKNPKKRSSDSEQFDLDSRPAKRFRLAGEDFASAIVDAERSTSSHWEDEDPYGEVARFRNAGNGGW